MFKPAVLATLTLVGFGSPAWASGPLYERTLMAEADRRCGLFTPDIRAALAASRLQARTAALRAKLDAPAVERRARARAAAVPCRGPDLQTAADRVRQAHRGWARLTRMEFPGASAGWRADRTPSEQVRWRLVQTAAAGAFGLAGVQPAAAAPYAVARLPRAARPALARLTVGRRVFLAETRGPSPELLETPGRGRSWAFRFPAAAAAALAASSPNEPARIEIFAADRDQSLLARMPIEIGDFAAGQAFVGQARTP